jgi:uncharacterized protein
MTLDEKYASLIGLVQSKGSAAVAFSGGVDSSFLCYASVSALGPKAIAFTVVSPMLPRVEIECAKRVAALVGITHVLLNEAVIDEEVAANPKERCYYCKKIEFARIIEAARERGVAAVFDGSNTDDMNDYRPGLKALAELNVCSPLREAGLCKAEIRELSRRFALPTWNKPAFACLASRIPYGERIDTSKLSRIERAEEALMAEGFTQFRVRSHGDVARVEVARDERKRFFSEETLDRVSRKIKEAGFLYAALELEGYAMGSLNRTVRPECEGVGKGEVR